MWDDSIYEKLNVMQEKVRMGGGKQRIAKQHSMGKLTARERLVMFFDEGEFNELNQMTTSRATEFGMKEKKTIGDGVIAAYGKVNGRLVAAISQDFTVCGGAGGEEHVLKICELLEKAIQWKIPFINFNDSGGARIEEGIGSLAAYSRLFKLNSMASGYIPQIAAVMGPCAGGAAYSPGLCDFVFMVEKTSQMYLTGPGVIKITTGEEIAIEDLGGSSVHTHRSGVAHFSYKDDASCIEGIKKLLSYLPSNCDEYPVDNETYVPMDLSKGLEEVVSQNQRYTYDMHAVIGAYLDKKSFFEVHKDFAGNVIVGFGHIDGKKVGIVANQPKVMGGALDCDASDKAARFVRFCDCFNIPLITFVDVPGFYPSKKQEYAGVIRHGAKLLYAFGEASVPKICLIVRKGFGGAYCAMNSKALGADIVYAWPIAQIAVMGADGAAGVIFRKQIAESDNPEATRDMFIKEYEDGFMNPYVAAQRGYVDEVISPVETKEKLKSALELCGGKTLLCISKKHDNMPM